MSTQRRARLSHARMNTSGEKPIAEVELDYNGRAYSGASDPERDAPFDDVQKVALAALAASESLIGKRSIFDLNFARAITIGDNPVVLVTATVDDAGRELELLGASHVSDDDVLTASARATLDAVNRYVDLFLVPGAH